MTVLKIELSATVIAWYGAIVATISAVIGILNHLRDRARIEIRYKGGWEITGPMEALYSKDKTYFSIKVINKGRRPMNIEKAAIRCIDRNMKYMLLSDSFSSVRNRLIDEKQPTSEFLVEEDLIDFRKAWYILIVDATGREYRKYFRIFPIFWRVYYFLRYGK